MPTKKVKAKKARAKAKVAKKSAKKAVKKPVAPKPEAAPEEKPAGGEAAVRSPSRPQTTRSFIGVRQIFGRRLSSSSYCPGLTVILIDEAV
jgi:pyruvate/2-oxoglutarate dehydrogenase complex dihydrolipoamide acyltransferase (E2) component